MSAERETGSPRPEMLYGVTGTNGKTTTTTLLSYVLRSLGQTTAHSTSLETRICGEATPITAFNDLMCACAERGITNAVCEITSRALSRGMSIRTPFDIGVFTNFTRDHMETHGTAENYLAAKASLFATLRRWPADAHRRSVAVLNGEDPATALILLVTRPDVRLYTFGFEPAPRPECVGDREATHLWASDVEVDATRTRFTLHAPALMSGEPRLEIKLAGRHMVANVLAALAALHGAGHSLEDVTGPVCAFDGVPGRFEPVPGPPGSPHVFVDFAHTPDGIRCALETARAVAARTPGATVTIVFGASGGYDAGKRPEMGVIAAALADRVIITTDNARNEPPAEIARQVRRDITGGHVTTVLDRAAAIETGLRGRKAGDVVLVAGKGAEVTQKIGRHVLPFSDVAVVRSLLARFSR